MPDKLKNHSTKIFLIIVISLTALVILFIITQTDLLQKKTLDESKYVRDGDLVFLNTALDVKYTGSESCRDCHKVIYDAYMKSPTGRSMSKLDPSNIIEDFPQREAVYDSTVNFYYEMVQRDNRFYQREYRLDDKGKIVHERLQEAQYIMGSGTNLRMYFYDDNGMFYQLPLTWYVHKNKWDLSPGYREFNNVRFSRFVSPMCFSCHNGHMQLTSTSDDRYEHPIHLGVGCESCHGPGDLHVRQTEGEKIEFASETVLTIVNPPRLSPQRRIDVCQQCHLEGKSWALRGENTWFDFRPGMLLASHRSIYSPAKAKKEAFSVANSAYRLLLSRCSKGSHSAMTCDLCHDSHGTIQTPLVEYNRQNCQKCHPPQSLPGEGSRFAHSANDDCIPCHMTRTGTENTLHGVVNTDHWIRVDADKDTIDWSSLREMSEEDAIVKLIADIDYADGEKDIRKGMAYYDYWSDRTIQRTYLDSSLFYLTKGLKISKNSAIGFNYLGKVYLEKKAYGKSISNLEKAIKLKPDYVEAYFNLGEAYRAEKKLNKAVSNFLKAIEFMPDKPDYWSSLGLTLAEKGDFDEAIDKLEQAIKIDKMAPSTYFNIGNLYVQKQNNPAKALAYFEKAVELDPDIPNGYLNLGSTYYLLEQPDEAISAYKKEYLFHPKSANALINLARVYTNMGKYFEARDVLHEARKVSPSRAIEKQLYYVEGLIDKQ